jgi:hypothetical protein
MLLTTCAGGWSKGGVKGEPFAIHTAAVRRYGGAAERGQPAAAAGRPRDDGDLRRRSRRTDCRCHSRPRSGPRQGRHKLVGASEPQDDIRANAALDRLGALTPDQGLSRRSRAVRREVRGAGYPNWHPEAPPCCGVPRLNLRPGRRKKLRRLRNRIMAGRDRTSMKLGIRRHHLLARQFPRRNCRQIAELYLRRNLRNYL